MPVTAFGQAMLDSVNGQPQQFDMHMLGGPSMTMNCTDFLKLRQDEKALIDGLGLPAEGSVLDWGCGIGRHLAYVRQLHPAVHCFGVDICDGMLGHCRDTFDAPATFATPETFEKELKNLGDQKFDLIMLMGNGLGVLGEEEDAVNGLRNLIGLLRPNGRILIETGNPFGKGYFSADFEINYKGCRDGPFTWGYADKMWVKQQLGQHCVDVETRPSAAPGGVLFFAIGQMG